ncbi:N-acetylmuramoyl-L-alanine amidase [Flavonifractor plautii]|uniref:N-acetylmuramoyl-L-alanine amidase n=1 Tax=Flavonifractor plautii TaxID=292800 RepID=UPI001FF1467B|nr:N-acetylmuramoyl-L-alanine amidase [Flavonifractor plautii]UOX45770.1 N-acetylmuramoyl-L-alanine amidase [Flavonifractor plautii]
MSKLITYIPLSSVERIELRVTNCRKTLSQVKEETGAHYVLNGGMWNPDGSACPLLKVGGVMRSGTPWRAIGYAWDKGPDIHMTSEYEGADNFIAVTALVASGKPVGKPSYGSAQGGKRGRSAIGLRGGSLALYCSSDGTDAATPEALRDELAGLGWASAVMLDGGGSSQCDFGGERITASRKVHNWICVWLKQGGQEPPDKEESMGKYKVTPSIGVNIRKGPGTGYGKAGAYPCGAVVDVLEKRDGWGRTDKGWVSLAYLEAVEAPQRVTDTGLTIQEDIISDWRRNRPGRDTNPGAYITIHETGNAAKGADAAAHGAYLDSDAGERDMVSWHYTVDDNAIVQHLPDYETAYHAGDGKDGPGNTTSIGIEICVNAGGDFEAAKANAAALVRLLMEEHGIDIEHVVQHNHWNGKDCPKTIRATTGAWEAFLVLCNGEPVDAELSAAVDKLAAKGLINSPDYWKGGVYSAANVQALIIKWAASL